MPEFQNPFKRCQGINSLVTVKPVLLCNHCDGKNEPKIKLKCRSNIVKKYVIEDVASKLFGKLLNNVLNFKQICSMVSVQLKDSYKEP